MGNTLVLPESTRGLLTSIGTIGPKRHPGLQLDKFSPAGESKEQRDALQHVCHCAGDDDLLAALRARREAVLRNTGARVFACETTGPLTLHLARAAALENVGICLHPVYGFVYLPGSGLKGMASAYAETVWLPTQHDRQAAWGTIERVFGCPLVESYGMTEAAHQMASNPLAGPRKPGAVGLPAGPEIAIMDEAGALLPQGAVGEVVIRGPNVTKGYENNPDANAKAFTEGWFRTGDQGSFDADGYLTLTGRLKELINRGGEKVSPLEVDETLMDHPAVQQDVNRALRRYDKLSGRLGDEFWHELTARIEAAAANPLRFHPAVGICAART